MSPTQTATMVATLGGQPQVITFALDALLARHVPIRQVVVVHLNDPAGRTARALRRLAAEFAHDGYPDINFQPYALRHNGATVPDIYDEADVDTVWQGIHGLLATLKNRQRHALHVCISGGRRILALLVMSAAMLHLGHHDRLWHIYTPRELRLQANEGAIMHVPPDNDFRLVQVPMLPWGSYFPILRQLAQPDGDVHDVMAGARAWLDADERARCHQVVDQLTDRQEDVLRAFAQGLSPQEVAEKLHITIKTVDTHKTAILKECRNAWALPPERWLDYHFLAEQFELFYG